MGTRFHDSSFEAVAGIVATVATVVYVTVLVRRALAALEERQV